MNAVIKAGGKQYYVTEGSEIFVEKIEANEGDNVEFNQVLMLDSKVGNPYLSGVTVQGEVLKNGKSKKDRTIEVPGTIVRLLERKRVIPLYIENKCCKFHK